MKLVLFGTGEDCLKCLDILRTLGIEPDYLTDNNPSKWGSFLEGKEIIPPQRLLEMECKIMISTSDYQEKIICQLRKMGLQKKIEKYIPVFQHYIQNKAESFHADGIVLHDKASILVDAFMGSGWDGDQQYACYVASELKKRGYNTHVYAKESLIQQSADTEKLISRFPFDKKRYWNTMLPIIKDMEQRLPFILIANSLEYVMAAAYILKQQYPDKIKILSVMHNDNYYLYESQAQWQDSLELIIGISEKIVTTLKTVWKIPEKKIYYRINPVFWEFDDVSFRMQQRFLQSRKCIQIGWGGRLAASQKNAHLLPKLINALETRNVDYILEIAGDGSYYNSLQKFLDEKGLKQKVRLLGRLDHYAMREFWKHQHIYINISEWEGCCLAMLEAMACGAVPVVTNVSGTSDVVRDGLTGFKIDLDEEDQMVDKIADKIVFLAQNMEKREEMSRESMKMVREKCNLEQYIDFIEELVNLDVQEETSNLCV